jgi:hypothetical protein
MGSIAEMLKDAIIMAFLCLTVITLLSCSPPLQSEGERLVHTYINAVQRKDYKTLYELRADLVDEVSPLSENKKENHFEFFKRNMEKKYENYEKGRERGELIFSQEGIVLIKAFVLGKGTFYQPIHWVQVSETKGFIDTLLEFGYAYINYDTFPEGTVIYLMGYPLGRIDKLTIQRSGKVVKKVLKEGRVRWWFEKKKPSHLSPSGWHIKSIEVLEDSMKYETVTWIF